MILCQCLVCLCDVVPCCTLHAETSVFGGGVCVQSVRFDITAQLFSVCLCFAFFSSPCLPWQNILGLNLWV